MPYHASTAKTIIGLDIFAVLLPTLQIATVGWTKAKTWCWWALPISPLSTLSSSGLDSSAVAPLKFETEASWSRMLLGESTDMEKGSFLPGQSWNHFHQWHATTSQQLLSLHFHKRQWENTTFVYASCGLRWLLSHIALSRWSRISGRWWVRLLISRQVGTARLLCYCCNTSRAADADGLAQASCKSTTPTESCTEMDGCGRWQWQLRW